MRKIWLKSDVEVLPTLKKTAKSLNINLDKFNKKTKLFIKLECTLYRYIKNKNGKF